MENFSFFDSAFNVNKTSTYLITIQFCPFGYSYCIKDTIRKQIVAIKNDDYSESTRSNYVDKIKDVIKSDIFLNKSYKNVDLVFRSDKFTLVPSELFNKSFLKSYFKFNFEFNDDEEIHFNKLKSANAYNLFVMPANITTFLVNKFPEVKFYQQGSPIIENLIERTKDSKSEVQTVYINVTKDCFDLISVCKGKLLFYNIFKYQTTEDFLYYILNIFKHLNYDIGKVDILLAGDIDEKSELYLKTYKYFANFNFAKIVNEYSYSFDVPEHSLSNILI
jgi:hypothetical protein